MAITLRDTTPNNTGKGSELTYLDMDTNLESYYFSSSLDGSTLNLFTTGSITHSIALAGTAGAQGADGPAGADGTPGVDGAQGAPGADSNVAGPQGAQGADGTPGIDGAQGAPGNAAAQGDPGIQGAQGADGPAGAQGADGTPGVDGAQGAPGADSNVAGPQGAQGAPGGGGGTPGGSNTHVQFNQLGAFGGDGGLTYVSASQILTVDKSTTPTPVSPNIFLLGNSSTAGALSGVIAGSATAGNIAPASIQFKNAVTHGLGDFGTDVLIKTAFSDGTGLTVERTAVNFTASGDTHFGFDIFAPNLDNTVQDNVVGFNSTTGELTYFATPGPLTRPGSATAISFDTQETLSDLYSISTLLGVDPTANGQISVNSNDPATVNTIEIRKNDDTGTSRIAILEAMTVSGSIFMQQGAVYANYRITSIDNQANFLRFSVTYIAANSSGSPWSTVINSGNVDALILNSDYVHQLTTGYNRLSVTNNSGVTKNFKLALPINTAVDPNSEIYVELFRAAGGNDIIPVYMARGFGGNVADMRNYDIYVHENSATATKLTLEASDTAILKFTTWNIGSGGGNRGLSLVSADRVIV